MSKPPGRACRSATPTRRHAVGPGRAKANVLAGATARVNAAIRSERLIGGMGVSMS